MIIINEHKIKQIEKFKKMLLDIRQMEGILQYRIGLCFSLILIYVELITKLEICSYYYVMTA